MIAITLTLEIRNVKYLWKLRVCGVLVMNNVRKLMDEVTYAIAKMKLKENKEQAQRGHYKFTWFGF